MAAEWWRLARDEFLGMADGPPADAVTFYYDPIVDRHVLVPVMIGGLLTAFYQAPQGGRHEEDALALFDAALRQAGGGRRDQPQAWSPRTSALSLLLARDFGLDDVAAAYQQAAEELYEPTWDAERGEHTWGFGLGEPHPRGQYNALMAAAELAGAGAWRALGGPADTRRFSEPTVRGVDFPDVCVTRAWWDAEKARLVVGLVGANEQVDGNPTSFTVHGLPPGEWSVVGSSLGSFATVTPAGEGTVRVDTSAASVTLVIGRAT